MALVPGMERAFSLYGPEVHTSPLNTQQHVKVCCWTNNRIKSVFPHLFNHSEAARALPAERWERSGRGTNNRWPEWGWAVIFLFRRIEGCHGDATRGPGKQRRWSWWEWHCVSANVQFPKWIPSYVYTGSARMRSVSRHTGVAFVPLLSWIIPLSKWLCKWHFSN